MVRLDSVSHVLKVLLSSLLALGISISSSSPATSPFFLKSTYQVKGEDHSHFFVRQVPGDGGCLFHSIATWLSYATFNKHLDFDWRMRYLSIRLRELSVDILQKNQTLYVEDNECIDTCSLLEAVGEHYNLSALDYCQRMLDPKTWGGGPEIVALSNHFQCPIHVYNLCTVGNFLKRSFRLELCAKFGSPLFDARAPIQLLCADGRFPNVRPGRQKDVGDHFLALFPCSSEEMQSPRCSLYDCPEFTEQVVFFDKRQGQLLSRLPVWITDFWDQHHPLAHHHTDPRSSQVQ
eukprot:gene8805-9709_t